MRKVLSYILIAAFLTSLFDVTDVSDINLGGEEIFSTSNDYADNEGDDLNDFGIYFSAATLFVLPAQADSFDFGTPDTGDTFRLTNERQIYAFSPGLLARPPII